MDCRITLNKNDSFLDMLQKAHVSGEKIYMLIDDNGLQAVDGYIEFIDKRDNSIRIMLDNGKAIPLHQVAALNGVFLPEYGEC